MERQPESLEPKARIPRRLSTVVGGIGISLMLATTACAHDPTTPKDYITPTPYTAEPPAWLRTPTPETLSLETSAPEYVKIMNKYYPELTESGLPIKHIEAITDSLDGITIVNYTEYELNEKNSHIVYNIFKEFSLGTQSKIQYSLYNNERSFVLSPTQAKSRTMLLIPANAPRPTTWLQLVPSPFNVPKDPSAATIQSTEEILSYVQVPIKYTNKLFPSIEQSATYSFAVEACQQMIDTAVLDTKGRQIKDPKETFIAQEIVCNSFGIAIAARLLGISYDEYFSFAIATGLDIEPENEYPLLVFNRPSYSQLPITGGILK